MAAPSWPMLRFPSCLSSFVAATPSMKWPLGPMCRPRCPRHPMRKAKAMSMLRSPSWQELEPAPTAHDRFSVRIGDREVIAPAHGGEPAFTLVFRDATVLHDLGTKDL